MRTRAYRQFRERLKQARAELRLTQEEAGRLFGFSQPQVSDMEIGERFIDAVELAVIAKAYGKPVTFFTDGLADIEEDGPSE